MPLAVKFGFICFQNVRMPRVSYRGSINMICIVSGTNCFYSLCWRSLKYSYSIQTKLELRVYRQFLKRKTCNQKDTDLPFCHGLEKLVNVENSIKRPKTYVHELLLFVPYCFKRNLKGYIVSYRCFIGNSARPVFFMGGGGVHGKI